jgi:hypothetical protein
MISKTIGWSFFFKQKNWENSRIFLVSSVNSTYWLNIQSNIYLLNFAKILTQKLKNICNGKLQFVSKNIVSNEHLLILFHYLMSITFLSKHCVSWHVHIDLPTCQNVDMLIVWRHEMMGCMLLFMPLTCAQGESQYKCKWTKNLWNFNLVQWKPHCHSNFKNNHKCNH